MLLGTTATCLFIFPLLLKLVVHQFFLETPQHRDLEILGTHLKRQGKIMVN